MASLQKGEEQGVEDKKGLNTLRHPEKSLPDPFTSLSVQTPSQDSNSKGFGEGFYYEFEFLFGRDKKCFIRRLERWCSKSPLLLFFLKRSVELYYGVKVEQTITQVDPRIRAVAERWNVTGDPDDEWNTDWHSWYRNDTK